MKHRVFTLLLTAALVVTLLAAPVSAADAPLKLSCSLDGQTAAVAIVTTGAITLSNYDVRLAWDTSVFTITGITNGQSSLFTNFQSNVNPDDANAGKISAASSGENVTVPAGATLATYSFSVADGAAAKSYSFTLTVRDAANEDGDALAWKGESVSGSVQITGGSGESSAPLKLSCSLDGQTAAVAIVAAGAITLSNYDVRLAWDTSVFTITGITNGQSSLFTNFQSNVNPDDANAGKISAASSGENVTVPAGATLATYRFTVADGAAAKSYSFTLTVRDAANEDGDALAWKGETVSGSVALTQQPSSVIKSVQANGLAVTVQAICPQTDAVLYLASYTSSGQMLEVFTADVEAGQTEYTFTLTDPAAYVKAFLTDTAAKPLCEAVRSE